MIRKREYYLIHFTRFAAFIALLFALNVSHATSMPYHQLKVELQPDAHRIIAEDQVNFPDGNARTVYFWLHQGLSPAIGEGELVEVENQSQNWLRRYRLTLPEGKHSFTLKYAGEIFHPPQQDQREARVFEKSPGIISTEGSVLSSASGWYPLLDNGRVDAMLTFSLEIVLPDSWHSVSQGKRTSGLTGAEIGKAKESWQEQQPQDEIYLIAGPLVLYQRNNSAIENLVYLRNRDAELAQNYLDATSRYIAIYRKLIGEYPYAKFALVENFWETGYGMPSFTLLGSQVIRLPFIIDTSYPHEILHNWWGNSVYVDYGSGNWSEGLTAYLADHLIQEQKGSGAEYRRGALQKYTDFVSSARDFPIKAFTSRHSAQSEAVGYGKTMMMFHMLRRAIGEEKFIRGLRSLYNDYKFVRTSFKDLEQVFSQAAGKDLSPFFAQWVQQTGAPMLKLVSAEARISNTGFELVVSVDQVQDGPAYAIDLPLAVTLQGSEQAYTTLLEMNEKHQEWRLKLSSLPLRVDVDPEFDLFRRLDTSEIPPAFSQVFGAEKLKIILPSHATESLKNQYVEAAKKWQLQPGRQAEILWDDQISTLPKQGAIWLFGWENRWFDRFREALLANDAHLTDQNFRYKDHEYSRDQHSITLTARMQATSVAWLGVPDARMMATLARKLPHYSKYSYAIFSDDNLNNLAKGIWTLGSSALTMPVHYSNGEPKTVPLGKLGERDSLAH